MKHYFVFFLFLPVFIFAKTKEVVFVENKGQIIDASYKLRNEIFFISEFSGVKLFFQKNKISFVFSEIKFKEDKEIESGIAIEDTYRIDLEFLNANPNCTIKGEDYTSDYSNYYYAHCKQGITNVKSCKKIVYKEIYSNIDLVFYGMNDGSLKYDFIVKPDGNPSNIQYQYNGALSQTITKAGELVVVNTLGSIIEKQPYSFQNVSNNTPKQKIATQYKLSNNTISLEVGAYDSTQILVIDPWATFYGGNSVDVGLSIATDSLKNVVFTGFCTSLNFPVSVGAFQSIKPGSTDAFVVKFDADGNRLWATFYGGSSDEEGHGICTDSNNNIIIAGNTRSSNLPIVPWAFQPTNIAGSAECFIAKFNPSGARLWDTYYGGVATDDANGICTDRNNNIIIVGETDSPNFPISAGAFQSTLNGFMDGFVVKFDSVGNRIFATYYGGFDPTGLPDETAHCVAADTNCNIFFTGVTPSSSFPLTSDAFQSVYMGSNDCFIVKLDSLGNKLYSSYFGGSSADYGYGIGIDFDNNLAISGQTSSLNFPVTPGAFQTSKSTFQDQFVAKFDNNCVQMWTTYFGGTGVDHNLNGNSLAIAECNKISFTGTTYSLDFPVTSNATQPDIDGMENPFISQLDENGNLVYSTYYGCGHHEYSSIAVGKNNSLLITGWTDSYCFPASDSSFQETFAGGGVDAFVACDYYDTTHCVIPPVIPPCEAVLLVPNVFTPNGDKINDSFLITIDCLENYHLIIYNRWGESVFETENSSDSWNGKIKNSQQTVSDGIYYYIIEYRKPKGENEIKKGFVMLLK